MNPHSNKRPSVQDLLLEAYDIKGLPNDERAECSALCAISNDPTLFDQVNGSLLLPDYFSVMKYREIYEAMVTVRTELNKPLSFITIGEELKRRGCQDLSVIVELSAQADPLPLPQIALYLRDLYQRRLMITQSIRMVHDCQSREHPAQELITESVDFYSDMTRGLATGNVTLQDKLREVHQVCVDNRDPNRQVEIIRTGIPFIDRSGGLLLNGFTIIGAATSQGKSALAEYLALQAIKQHVRTAYYSLEMSALKLSQRLVAIESGINNQDLRLNPLSDAQFAHMHDVVCRMGQEYASYLCLDERPTSNFAAIVASIRQRADLHRRDRVRLFVVDYMQILQGSGLGNDLRDRDVQMFMAMLSRTFFNLTQEFGIGIIALSQFNRERDDPEPTLNRLRDSNQIGDAADDIWLLYRPEAYGKRYSTDPTVDPSGTALVLVQKRRDGPTGHFFMGFDAPCTRFYPFTDEREIPRRRENGTMFL